MIPPHRTSHIGGLRGVKLRLPSLFFFSKGPGPDRLTRFAWSVECVHAAAQSYLRGHDRYRSSYLLEFMGLCYMTHERRWRMALFATV